MIASIEGWYAGLEGIDPRLCPYDKLTIEWKDWNRMFILAVKTFYEE